MRWHQFEFAERGLRWQTVPSYKDACTFTSADDMPLPGQHAWVFASFTDRPGVGKTNFSQHPFSTLEKPRSWDKISVVSIKMSLSIPCLAKHLLNTQFPEEGGLAWYSAKRIPVNEPSVKMLQLGILIESCRLNHELELELEHWCFTSLYLFIPWRRLFQFVFPTPGLSANEGTCWGHD